MNTELVSLLAAVAFGGAMNMLLLRAPWPKFLGGPMDGGRRLSDGRRLFGDNKTWKGFIGMTASTSLCVCAFHGLGALPGRTLVEAAAIGAALGLAYVAAELPNSFIKRRLDIRPGGLADRGPVRMLQLLIDQADSVLGCTAVLAIVTSHSPQALILLAVLAITVHFAMNILLYSVGLKQAWT